MLGVAQPLVSKHLRVLREVGLVDVRDVGRQRLYRLNGQPLKPIHDWVNAYEATWSRLSLTEESGRTLLTILVDHPGREIRDMVIQSGMQQGMQEALDHLEEVAISLR